MPTVGAPWVAQRVWAMPMAGQRRRGELALQIVELALGAAALEPAVVDRAEAGRIIAAIFEPLEPVEQPLRDVAGSDDPDNSAHSINAFLAKHP